MSKINYKPLPEKTADAISDMIYRNNYRVGAKLPNEIDLAGEFEVSRNTVREAIRILVSRNVLEVKRGSGTFVSSRLGLTEDPLGLSLICDKKKLVKDLIQIRLMIEPKMASMAAEYANADEIKALEENCRKAEAAFNSGERYYELDMEFHTLIAGCSRNLVVHNLLPSIHQTILLQENMTMNRLGEKTLEGHRRIFEAIARRRCNDAYDAMLAHLVLNQDRISRLDEG